MAARILLCALSLILGCNSVAAAPTTSNPLTSWKSTLSEGTTKASSGFSIQQVKNPNWTPRPVNITDLYVNTLRKYRASIPPSVYGRSISEALAVEERQTTFKLAAYFTDAAYTVPIQLGTPALTLYVTFDTGSADLWVFSSGMPTSESSGHTIYSPAKSSTSQLAAGQNFSVSYGSGTVSGDVYTDVLGIGTISVSGYPMETALQAGSNFVSAYNSSGIWGTDMSTYQSQGPSAQPTWLIFADYDIGITLFTVNYVYFGAGTITFGTIDSTQYTGSISYTPVIANFVDYADFWAVNATGFSVGTGTSQAFSIGGAVLDTGTTLTYLPAPVVAAYWAQVSGSQASGGNYYWPCDTTLPDLHLTFQGGATVTLHGRYFNPYGFESLSGYTCQGGLQANTGIGFSILGQAVFQSMFVVMDLGGSRVGFATKTLLD